jgi:hypothetical protein
VIATKRNDISCYYLIAGDSKSILGKKENGLEVVMSSKEEIYTTSKATGIQRKGKVLWG